MIIKVKVESNLRFFILTHFSFIKLFRSCASWPCRFFNSRRDVVRVAMESSFSTSISFSLSGDRGDWKYVIKTQIYIERVTYIYI